jgi:hypothetical protein
MQDRQSYVCSISLISWGGRAVPIAGVLVWFDKFEVDFQYPHNAVFFIATLDLIFQCFCVVLPYSLNCVSPN